MLVAAARVKEMAAQKRISVANLLPQLNGKIEAEREVENYGGHSRDVGNSYEAKALLSWELDLWGNLRWKKVAAVADYLQSVESQRAIAYDNCCGSGAGILRAGSTRYRIGNCPSDTKGS